MSKDGLLPKIAYICMEFGLHEDFPIYSGGLGVLAGDYLKAARDENLPVVGVGILWRKGYTRQAVSGHGELYDLSEIYATDFLKDTGVKVQVKIKNKPVTCKVWLVDHFDNAPLYLLDADLPENENPWLTHHLYRGDTNDRISQEMILGIGGIRALRALNIHVDLYHFNEGHAVFAGLELIREKMEKGFSFHEAWARTREEIVFTTHTPVAAGNEVHPHAALGFLGAYNGLHYEEMKSIGGDPFNMTVAALRLSRLSNAVSRLHRVTAEKMWNAVPGISRIIGITNGVHRKTWQDPEIDRAFQERRGLREAHRKNKERLLAEIRQRTGRELDPDVLLIGFARRAATYKRGDLLFNNRERLLPFLQEKKLQLVFAGKAHPQDEAGKDTLRRIIALAREFPESIVFLENYNMGLGKLLTRGCDLWLNTPRRPLEACGTSGMKAAMNGILNLSTLDGWWDEGCRHGINGWQFGDGYEGPDQDLSDQNALFHTLEHEVLPVYYRQPERWEFMMYQAIDSACRHFSAGRMIREYFDRLYLPSSFSLRTGTNSW